MGEQSKRVLVTGGSRGIGKAICERFGGAGWEVWAPTRDDLDLTSEVSIMEFLKRNKDVTVDCLVNNAGENIVCDFESLPYELWQRMQHINLTAAYLLAQHVIGHMASQGWGRIVNISSCYGVVGRSGRAAYTTSKAGLNGLTVALAVEFGMKNILVNSVCPGFVETDLTFQNNTMEQVVSLMNKVALNRLAKPSEIAEVVYFLGSGSNTYITGQSILVDGGFVIQ